MFFDKSINLRHELVTDEEIKALKQRRDEYQLNDIMITKKDGNVVIYEVTNRR